jgi:hypothetical protein
VSVIACFLQLSGQQLMLVKANVANQEEGLVWKRCLGIAGCSLVSVASPTGSELWEY